MMSKMQIVAFKPEKILEYYEGFNSIASHITSNLITFDRNSFRDYDPKTLENDMNALRKEIKSFIHSRENWERINQFKFFLMNTYERQINYKIQSGRTGIALLYLSRPHNQKYLEEIRSNYLLLESAFQVSKNVIGSTCVRKDKKSAAFVNGNSAIFAVGAVLCYRIDDQPLMKNLINELLDMSNSMLSHDHNVLFDRKVQCLYSLLYLNSEIPDWAYQVPVQLIQKIIKKIISVGKSGAKNNKCGCPLFYDFTSKENPYCGAAFGLSGVLYLLLQARIIKREYVDDADLKYFIKPTVDFLIKQKMVNRKYKSSECETLFWCCGTSSFIFLFSIASRVWRRYPEKTNYEKMALDAGDVIWKKGLIKNSSGLCHGIAGNAYAFLQLYQITKDHKHLYRALIFTTACLNNKVLKVTAYDRYSESTLYEGLPGILYLCGDILNDPLQAKFPGVTLINR